MRILAITGTVVVVLVAIVVGVGYLLPVKHVASRERDYPAAPSAVFAAITTPVEFPTWRRDVRTVEILADESGRKRFREVGGNGAITYVVEQSVPHQRLVTRIADRSLPFGGSWTYELTPTQSGTNLRVTENGEVYNPVFRFMSRFVFGHHRTMDGYLSDLEKRLTKSQGAIADRR
jgi:hypothetical protein